MPTYPVESNNESVPTSKRSALHNGRRRYVLLLDDEEEMRGDVAAPSTTARGTCRFANPAPLGLLGFGMTTILLNLHNVGLYNLTTAVVGMGVSFGGIAQFVAGILEYFRGNTFAYVASASYGAFWISLVCLWMLDTNKVTPSLSVFVTEKASLGWYLLVWGLFTFFMFFSAIRTNLGITIVFGSSALLFLLLTIYCFSGRPIVQRIAGYEGIFCGASAIYVAIAEITNEVYGRELLPLVPMERLWGSQGEGGKMRDEASV